MVEFSYKEFLFHKHIQKPQNKFSIVIIHGLGEHCGRYKTFIDYIVSKGFNVLTFDLRGHGKSGGKRGHINKFDEFLTDIKHIVDFKSVNDFALLGHSMGGLIAIRYVQDMNDNRVKSLIVSGPLLGLSVNVPLWKKIPGIILSKILPSFTMDNGLNPEHLCHDKDVVKRYINDPYVHRKVSARWFTEILLNMKIAMDKTASINIPIMLLHGGSDVLTSPSATKKFFEKLPLKEKKIIIYENLYHEILNEPQKEMVYKDIIGFLQSYYAKH